MGVVFGSQGRLRQPPSQKPNLKDQPSFEVDLEPQAAAAAPPAATRANQASRHPARKPQDAAQLEAIGSHLQQLEPLGTSPSLLQVRNSSRRWPAARALLELLATELQANQRFVLERALGLGGARPERLIDIAVELGVSRERAGAIAKQGLKRLIKLARQTLTVSEAASPILRFTRRTAAAAALALYQGDAAERALRYARVPTEDLRREAVMAAAERDPERLWLLMDAYLMLHGAKGTRASERTRENYRRGLQDLLADWSHENLLRPSRDAGVAWVRQLERRLVLDKRGEAKRDPRTGELKRLSPSTIQVKLAAVRTLYKALRWAGASKESPFENVQVVRDPVPAWEKRGAYTPAEVDAVTRILFISATGSLHARGGRAAARAGRAGG